MHTKRASLPLFVLVLLVSGVLTMQAQPAGERLLEPTRREGSVKLERDPTVIRQRNVVVALAFLKGPRNEMLRLPLFDGEIVLVRDRQAMPRNKTLIWYGHVEGQLGSAVVLSNVREALAGDVMTRDRTGAFAFYKIRYAGNGVHVLSQIDQSKFPSEAPPDEPEVPKDDRDADSCGDPASFIDTLVVYTGAAREAAGGTSGIEAEIDEAVAVTNQSYLNSEVAHRLRLVHMQEVSYVESGNSRTDRNRLQKPGGLLKDVLTLRNTHAADVVALIVETLDNCGRSNVMGTVSHDFESSAYAVVLRKCAATYYSLAHELGHIMGARHDWNDDKHKDTPTIYNHGYVNKTPTPPGMAWRTIMAKDPDCSKARPENCAERIPYWSNPKLSFPPGGDAMGVDSGEEPSNNSRRLNDTAPIVANFRCASP